MNKTKITNDEHRKQEENLKRNLGKLQFTHLWFGQNLSCLTMVWNLTLYPPEVSSVKVP